MILYAFIENCKNVTIFRARGKFLLRFLTRPIKFNPPKEPRPRYKSAINAINTINSKFPIPSKIPTRVYAFLQIFTTLAFDIPSKKLKFRTCRNASKWL